MVAGNGGVGRGGERPLGEAELRRGEEGADGLVGGAGVAEAVQPQHEAPVAGRHGTRNELVGEAWLLRAAAEGGGEQGGRGDGGGEGEEDADQATHGSWAEPGRAEVVLLSVERWFAAFSSSFEFSRLDLVNHNNKGEILAIN